MSRTAGPRRIRLLPALVATLLAAAGAAASAGSGIALAERRSGYDLMSPQTRAMQDDDAGNPATLWVLEGEALWRVPSLAFPAARSLADPTSLGPIPRRRRTTPRT